MMLSLNLHFPPYIRERDFSSVELEALPVPLKHHCSVVYKGQVFVIGGKADVGFPRKEVYMLRDGRTWKETPAMTYAR